MLLEEKDICNIIVAGKHCYQLLAANLDNIV